MFNLKVSYETGGLAGNEKLIYVLYDPTPRAMKIFNENGRTYLNWWQSDLNRGESEQLLKKLQMQNLILGGLRYTGDSSDLKFEQGGNIGETLASSNPYIGGAKAIQGIAPESVSALDKKMARKINPDPNRPIFFENGGVSKYVGGGGVSKKEPKYYVFEVSYSMRKRGENRNQAGIYKQTITESATTEKGAEREAIKTIRSMHKYENVVFNHIAPKLIKEMTLLEYIESQRPRKYDNGGGVDTIAPFGTLVSKNKRQKLEYKKVGSNVEFMIYEGVNNPVSNYSRTSFKKSKNGSRIMNYEEFLKFINSNGFVDDQKYDNGGSVGQTDYSVAQTILNQLGGMKRLVIMTGAYNFVASPNAVSFRIKNRKVNYIKITLNGKDLYDVKFSRIFNYQEKVVAELNDIYFDQLIPIFEQNTGMYLKMFKKGGMVSTQNRDMVISQLKTIHHHEQEMLQTLKNSGEVEAWVLAKVSNASSDLSDIAHYLEFKG